MPGTTFLPIAGPIGTAWFLILTYTAIIWANATALPLIARTILGETFQFGYLFETMARLISERAGEEVSKNE